MQEYIRQLMLCCTGSLKPLPGSTERLMERKGMLFICDFCFDL